MIYTNKNNQQQQNIYIYIICIIMNDRIKEWEKVKTIEGILITNSYGGWRRKSRITSMIDNSLLKIKWILETIYIMKW